MMKIISERTAKSQWIEQVPVIPQSFISKIKLITETPVKDEELLLMLRNFTEQQRGLPVWQTRVVFGLVVVFTVGLCWQPDTVYGQYRLPSHRKRDKPLPSVIQSMPGINHELDIVRHRSQLIITRSKVVRTAIANPGVIDIVQYNPNELSIIGLGLGSTTLMLWFEDNPEPLIYLVRTIRDPDLEDQRRIDYGKLERKIAVLFPNSKVYLIPLSYKIIVKGQARDGEEAARILQIVRGEVINQRGNLFGNGNGDDGFGNGGGAGTGGNNGNGFGLNNNLASSLIVNMLDVPGEHQIKLRVRIAQLDRAMLRRQGVDLNVLINGGRHALTTTLAGIPSTFTATLENGEVGVLVNWLASNGTAKILSEPTLTVISGHTASFLSGGEFAVPTIVGIGGAQGQSTTFRGFGTSLIVTPTVIDKDLIRMQIVPEFSSINSGNSSGGVLGLNTQRIQTTVQLREGQTIALAGLISHQTNTEVTRIPFLGELPWIGPKIFSSKTATQDETELLILVTPELVRAMDSDEVPPVPGFYVTHPNDQELYHYGMTEGVPDPGYYQLAPLGRGSGHGVQIGYRVFNPEPASRIYSPTPNASYGNGGLGTGGRNPASNPGGYNNSYDQPQYGQPTFPTPATGMPGTTQPSPVPPMVPQANPTPQQLPPPPSASRQQYQQYPVRQSGRETTQYPQQQFRSSQSNRNSNRAYQPQLRTPSIQPTGAQQRQSTQTRSGLRDRFSRLPRFNTSRR